MSTATATKTKTYDSGIHSVFAVTSRTVPGFHSDDSAVYITDICVFMAVGVLGEREACLGLVYILLGVIGVPAFAGFS